MLLIGLSVLLLITVVIIAFSVSKFGDISGILNNNYNSGCEQDNRQYPECKVPGSYLGLNKPERDGLLTKFVMDNKYKS